MKVTTSKPAPSRSDVARVFQRASLTIARSRHPRLAHAKTGGVPAARPRSPSTRQAPVMTHRPRCRMPTNPLDPGRLAPLNTTSVPYPAVDLKHATAPPASEEGEAVVGQGLGALRRRRVLASPAASPSP
eukprot:6112553-Prymnesium_polylepis.2